MAMTRFRKSFLPSRKLCSLAWFTVFPHHHVPWECDVKTHWWLSLGKLGGSVKEKNGVGDAESSGSVQAGERKVKKSIWRVLLLF